MITVRISEQANRALLDILSYIAQDNPAAALNLRSDLQKRVMQTLGVFPGAGMM